MEALAKRVSLVRHKLQHWDGAITAALTQDHPKLRPKRDTERISQHINQHFVHAIASAHSQHRDAPTGRGLRLSKKQHDEAVSEMLKLVAAKGVSGATAQQLEVERQDVARCCMLLLQLESWLDIAGGNDFLAVPPLHLGAAHASSDVFEEAFHVVKIRFGDARASSSALLQMASSSFNNNSGGNSGGNASAAYELLLKIESDLDTLVDTLHFTCSVDRRLLAVDHGYSRLIDICCSVRVRKAVSSERESFLAAFDQSAQTLRNLIARLLSGYSTFLVYHPPTYAVIQARFDAVCHANRAAPLSVSVKHSLTYDAVAVTVELLFAHFKQQVPESLVVLVAPHVPDAILGMGGAASSTHFHSSAVGGASGSGAAASGGGSNATAATGGKAARPGSAATQSAAAAAAAAGTANLMGSRDAKAASVWRQIHDHESRQWAKRYRRSGAAGRYASLLVIQRAWRNYIACRNAVRAAAARAMQRAQRRAVQTIELWFRALVRRRERRAVVMAEAALRRGWVRAQLEAAGFDIPGLEWVEYEQRLQLQEYSTMVAAEEEAEGQHQQHQQLIERRQEQGGAASAFATESSTMMMTRDDSSLVLYTADSMLAQQRPSGGVSGRLRAHELQIPHLVGVPGHDDAANLSAAAAAGVLDISGVSAVSASSTKMMLSALRGNRSTLDAIAFMPSSSAGGGMTGAASSSVYAVSSPTNTQQATTAATTTVGSKKSDAAVQVVAAASSPLRLQREQREAIVFGAARRVQSFFRRVVYIRTAERRRQQQQAEESEGLPPLSRANVSALCGRPRSSLLDRYRRIRREQQQQLGQVWRSASAARSDDDDDDDGDGAEGGNVGARRGGSLAPSIPVDDEDDFGEGDADAVVRRIRRADRARSESRRSAAAAAADDSARSSVDSFTFLSLLHAPATGDAYDRAAEEVAEANAAAAAAATDPNSSGSVVDQAIWLRRRTQQQQQHHHFATESLERAMQDATDQKSKRASRQRDQNKQQAQPQQEPNRLHRGPMLHQPITDKHLLQELARVPKVFTVAANGALLPPSTAVDDADNEQRRNQEDSEEGATTATAEKDDDNGDDAAKFGDAVEKLENHRADELALAAMRGSGNSSSSSSGGASRLLLCACATFLVGQHNVELAAGFTAVTERPRWVLEELHDVAAALRGGGGVSVSADGGRLAKSKAVASAAAAPAASASGTAAAPDALNVTPPPRVLSSDDDEPLSAQKIGGGAGGNSTKARKEAVAVPLDRNALLSPCRENRLRRRDLEQHVSPLPPNSGSNKTAADPRRFYRLVSTTTAAAAVASPALSTAALVQYTVQNAALRHPYQNWSNASVVLRLALARGLQRLVEVLRGMDLRSMFQFNEGEEEAQNDAANNNAAAGKINSGEPEPASDAAAAAGASAADDGANATTTSKQQQQQPPAPSSLADRQRAQALDSTLQLLCETAGGGTRSLHEAIYLLSTDISKLVADENRPIVSILRTALGLESRRLIVPWLIVVGAAAEFAELDPAVVQRRQRAQEQAARREARGRRRAARAMEQRLRDVRKAEWVEQQREEMAARLDAEQVARHQQRQQRREAAAARRKQHASRRAQRAIDRATRPSSTRSSSSSSSSASSVSSVVSSVSSSTDEEGRARYAADAERQLAADAEREWSPLSSVSASTTASDGNGNDDGQQDPERRKRNADDLLLGSEEDEEEEEEENEAHSVADDDGVAVVAAARNQALPPRAVSFVGGEEQQQQPLVNAAPVDPFAALECLSPARGGAVFTDDDALRRRHDHFASVALAAISRFGKRAQRSSSDGDGSSGFAAFQALLSRPHSLVRKWLDVPLAVCVPRARGRLRLRVDLLLLGALLMPFLQSLQRWFEHSFVLSEEDRMLGQQQQQQELQDGDDDVDGDEYGADLEARLARAAGIGVAGDYIIASGGGDDDDDYDDGGGAYDNINSDGDADGGYGADSPLPAAGGARPPTRLGFDDQEDDGDDAAELDALEDEELQAEGEDDDVVDS